MKIVIMGRTASGKDALASQLGQLGLSVARTATTRPRRPNEGDTHEFVDDEAMDEIWGTAVAHLELGGYRYCVTPETLASSDVLVLDPDGMRELARNVPDEHVMAVRMAVDDTAREKAAKARGGVGKDDERAAEEALAFATLDTEPMPDNVPEIVEVRNDYRPETIDEVAHAIRARVRVHARVMDAIRECARYGSVVLDDAGRMRFAKGGHEFFASVDRAAGLIMSDRASLGDLLYEWLSIDGAATSAAADAPEPNDADDETVDDID